VHAALTAAVKIASAPFLDARATQVVPANVTPTAAQAARAVKMAHAANWLPVAKMGAVR
jgi:hypothetical protein